MRDLYQLARPILFRLDPEDAHTMTLRLLKTGMVPRCAGAQDEALAQTLWGLKFPNPVGLAAGFDKNAEVIGPVLSMGFGFAEAGTVTPKPQHGNPRPRIFRDPGHEAVINRLGFPSVGMNAFKANLEKFLSRKPVPRGVVGINIGMNKSSADPAKDYAVLINMLGPMADYLTINISSPNTPGLRDLQEPGPLAELLGVVMEQRRKACGTMQPPLLLKLAPDLEEDHQGAIAATVMDAGIDGLILTNTTISRPGDLPETFAHEKGGLSGQPLKDLSTRVIRNFYRLTKGRIPIIGAGGVSSGSDAYAKIKAGASLVQLYSALVFRGPSVANSINQELSALLKKDGYPNITAAIGIDARGGA